MNEHRERPTMGARPEETLRLVAQLPAPDDLTDRVHARVRQAMAAPAGANRGFWQLWTPARRMQFAGAGVLALALAGSAWSVFHGHQHQPGTAPAIQSPNGGNFGGAKAERVPPTLKPILVPDKKPAAKKKPAASRIKPASTTDATPAKP